jgi:hypothetical protein
MDLLKQSLGIPSVYFFTAPSCFNILNRETTIIPVIIAKGAPAMIAAF